MTENHHKHKNMGDGSQDDPGTPSPNSRIRDLAPPIQGSYHGGKGAAGAYQRLINWIPPHETYVEPFLGGGSVMINKKPARWSVGVDKDYDVIRKWAKLEHDRAVEDSFIKIPIPGNRETMNLVYHDAIKVIERYKTSTWFVNPFSLFIFCDPPYIMETRSSPSRIYKYEYAAEQHVELLKLLASLKCMVMITGYRHTIYDDALSSWRRKDYKTSTRGGLKNESCWMNYPEPNELHDYRYLGSTFKKREQIKLKQQRWLKRLNNMPILERRAMMDILNRPSGI